MLLTTLYIIGITAEAMTGALSAGRRDMDYFGVMVIACVTAIGGGSVRDIILGHYPLTWVAHPEYLFITCFASLIAIFISPWIIKFKQLFIRLDALGLAVFSLIGTQVGLDMGLHFSVCIVASIITGVFGGLLRDLLCHQAPLVLHKELYASVCILVSGVYLSALHFHIDPTYSASFALILGYIVRMLSVRFQWGLPQFKLPQKNLSS